MHTCLRKENVTLMRASQYNKLRVASGLEPVDFGTFTVCCELTADEANAAIDYYFGQEAPCEQRRHDICGNSSVSSVGL